VSDFVFGLVKFVAGAALVIGVLALVIWRGARRDRGLQAVAESLGLTYARRDDGPLASFAGLKVFDAIGVRSLANVAAGTIAGSRVWLLDYRYSQRPVGTVERCGFSACVLQDDRLDLPRFRLASRGRPRSMTLSPIVQRPDDDPEVPLDGCSELARDFVLFTRTPDVVLPLLGPALEQRLPAIRKPYLEIEGRRDLLAVTRRSWIEPNDARALLEQASWILDDLRRACPR
jgi:hypothetical protein